MTISSVKAAEGDEQIEQKWEVNVSAYSTEPDQEFLPTLLVQWDCRKLSAGTLDLTLMTLMVLSVIMSWLWKRVFTAPLDNLWPVISFLPLPWTWPGLEQNHKITPQSPFAHNVLSMCPSNEWCLFKTRAERWQCLKNRCWSIVWRHLEELKCLLRCIHRSTQT